MVFFANSGAGYPIEPMTEEAGSTALDAASDMWQMISRLENRNRKWHQKTADLARSSSEKLRKSARYYEDIAAFTIGDNNIDIRSALQTAKVSLNSSLNQNENPIRSIKNLYLELSKRLYILSEAIDRIDIGRDNFYIRDEIFDIMRKWEIAASLARLIAVGNSDGFPRSSGERF